MFQDYIQAGHQGASTSTQTRVGIDLMQVNAWQRQPQQLYTILYVGRNNTQFQVYMSNAEFDEFLTKLKTANRLKKAYE